MSNIENTAHSQQDLEEKSTFTLVTIKVNNIDKALFRFELKKSGDVLMYCKHAQFYRDSGTKPNSEEGIKQQRYSFHKSQNSADGINFIKQTLDTTSTAEINTYIVTPVIKKKSGFVHIFSRRTPDLTPERHNANKKSKYRILDIDEYDSRSSTLFYSIFVGSSNVQVPNKVTSANVLSFIIGDFRYLVIWAYLPIPSHNTGNLVHSGTIKTDTGEILGQVEGVNTLGAIALSYDYFKILIIEYNSTLNACQDAPVNLAVNTFKSVGLRKDGLRFGAKRRGIYKK